MGDVLQSVKTKGEMLVARPGKWEFTFTENLILLVLFMYFIPNLPHDHSIILFKISLM